MWDFRYDTVELLLCGRSVVTDIEYERADALFELSARSLMFVTSNSSASHIKYITVTSATIDDKLTEELI